MNIKRKNIIEFLIVAIICVGGIMYFQNSTNNFEKRLLKEGKFAIGTFNSFGYAYKAGGKNYKYTYYNEIDGLIKNKTDQVRMPKSEQQAILIKGDQFLVLYNEEGSEIYFDHPIKDSIDFKKYILNFKEMRIK